MIADAVSVQNQLDKYHGELSYHGEVFDTMNNKVAALEDLNQHKQIPQLKETQQVGALV